MSESVNAFSELVDLSEYNFNKSPNSKEKWFRAKNYILQNNKGEMVSFDQLTNGVFTLTCSLMYVNDLNIQSRRVKVIFKLHSIDCDNLYPDDTSTTRGFWIVDKLNNYYRLEKRFPHPSYAHIAMQSYAMIENYCSFLECAIDSIFTVETKNDKNDCSATIEVLHEESIQKNKSFDLEMTKKYSFFYHNSFFPHFRYRCKIMLSLKVSIVINNII